MYYVHYHGVLCTLCSVSGGHGQDRAQFAGDLVPGDKASTLPKPIRIYGRYIASCSAIARSHRNLPGYVDTRAIFITSAPTNWPDWARSTRITPPMRSGRPRSCPRRAMLLLRRIWRRCARRRRSSIHSSRASPLVSRSGNLSAIW